MLLQYKQEYYLTFIMCALLQVTIITFPFVLANHHVGSFVGSALGCWVKEGLGLVVHIPSGCVAKINIP
jgi:hypothetical protein